MKELSLEDISPVGASFVDPNGFLFEYKGELLRGINPNQENFYRKLVSEADPKLFFGQEPGIVKSQISNFSIPERNCNLVIEHERIRPLTFCVEWSPSMLKDAALLTLNLCRQLNKLNLTLQDAYPWNIVFSGTKPIMVDLTSIIPVQGSYIWPAYQQYLNFFFYPLMLSESGKSKVARYLLSDTINGINTEEYLKHLGLNNLVRHPIHFIGTKLSNYLAKIIQNNDKIRIKLQESMKQRQIKPELRENFIKGLISKTEDINLKSSKTNWSHYYQEIDKSIQVDIKLKTIEKILDRIRPETVLDVGCNAGKFSRLAAKKGARVISVDGDVECIESVYHMARKESLPITPLVIDILNPTPPLGQVANQFAPFEKRARSEMVLALALMHHLHINGRQSFSRIAQLFSELTTKYLVFEFVALDDANNALLDHGREIEYNLEQVCSALNKYFNLEILESDRETRKIILCELKE